MSADNAIVIRDAKNGGYTVDMEFMSSDNPQYHGVGSSWFVDYDMASRYAHNLETQDVVKYGVIDMTNHFHSRMDEDDSFLDMIIEENDRWTNRYYGVKDYGYDYDDIEIQNDRHYDAELERLLAEEEEIERQTREYHESQSNGSEW